MSLYLCYPPFGPPSSPYLSLPVLGGYLRSRGHGVWCEDANNRFIRFAGSPEKIREGLKKLESLEKSGTAPFWAKRTRRLVDLLGPRLFQLNTPEKIGSAGERNALFETVLSLISLGRIDRVVMDHASNSLGYLSPWSPYSLQESLEAAHAENTVLEGFFEEHILPDLEESKATLLGLSVAFAEQFHPALRLARLAKEALREVRIFLGGPFGTYHLHSLQKGDLFDLLDGVILGEGEESLDLLLRHEDEGVRGYPKIPGLLWREEGHIWRNPPGIPKKLESLPDPDFKDFSESKYFFAPQKSILPLRFSRGCWWNRCAFCRGYTSAYDAPSPEFLRSQVLRLLEKTSFSGFVLADACILPEVLFGFAEELLRSEVRLRWNAHFRFSPSLTLDKVLLLREAGCTRLFMGLESYNDRILKLMEKGITEKLIEKNLMDLAWGGMDTFLYLIVGFPSETEEEAWQGFRRLREHRKEGLSATCQFNPFILFPDSPVGRNPEKFGITRVIYDPREDLQAPAMAWEGPGMGMQRARELAEEFTRNMQEITILKEESL